MRRGDGQSGHDRIITAAVGIIFAALGAALLALSDRSIGPILAAIIVGGLGVEAVYSAYRHRICLLARIGPLP